MAKIEGTCREVLVNAEWMTLLTFGENTPHMVATWGEFVRRMGIEEEYIAVPVAWMHTTTENIEKNEAIEVLVASKSVEARHGYGQGCRIKGYAQLATGGAYAERAKELFPWARGALVIHVHKIETLL